MIRSCRQRMTWRKFNLGLTVAMAALWVAATLGGWIGDTRFIGHVSMLALVLAAWASYRADVPIPETDR